MCKRCQILGDELPRTRTDFEERTVGREPIEDSEAFITEVSWHYFVNEMTQAEIARMLNVTRLRVNSSFLTI